MGQIKLDRRWPLKCRAEFKLLTNGRQNRLIGVAKTDSPQAKSAIDIFVAVEIPDPAVFATRNRSGSEDGKLVIAFRISMRTPNNGIVHSRPVGIRTREIGNRSGREIAHVVQLGCGADQLLPQSG